MKNYNKNIRSLCHLKINLKKQNNTLTSDTKNISRFIYLCPLCQKLLQYLKANKELKGKYYRSFNVQA
jgi:hypothetical protein